VPQVPRPAAGLAAQRDVGHRLARLHDPAVQDLDVGADLAVELGGAAAQQPVGGHAVHVGEQPVDAYVPDLPVEQAHRDRRAVEDVSSCAARACSGDIPGLSVERVNCAYPPSGDGAAVRPRAADPTCEPKGEAHGMAGPVTYGC
jgi:hypothetical protein